MSGWHLAIQQEWPSIVINYDCSISWAYNLNRLSRPAWQRRRWLAESALVINSPYQSEAGNFFEIIFESNLTQYRYSFLIFVANTAHFVCVILFVNDGQKTWPIFNSTRNEAKARGVDEFIVRRIIKRLLHESALPNMCQAAFTRRPAEFDRRTLDYKYRHHAKLKYYTLSLNIGWSKSVWFWMIMKPPPQWSAQVFIGIDRLMPIKPSRIYIVSCLFRAPA